MIGSITPEMVREFIDYDPLTGVCLWRSREITHYRIKIWNKRFAGKQAGSLSKKGYLKARICGHEYSVSRLAWAYVHNKFPPDEIDHKNGVRDDNRICNLREATGPQNAQNISSKGYKINLVGLLGVGAHGNGYQARIRLNGDLIHLGTFATPEEAHAAYCAAKKVLHQFQPEPRPDLKIVA
jgi:hypothetical protein